VATRGKSYDTNSNTPGGDFIDLNNAYNTYNTPNNTSDCGGIDQIGCLTGTAVKPPTSDSTGYFPTATGTASAVDAHDWLNRFSSAFTDWLRQFGEGLERGGVTGHISAGGYVSNAWPETPISETVALDKREAILSAAILTEAGLGIAGYEAASALCAGNLPACGMAMSVTYSALSAPGAPSFPALMNVNPTRGNVNCLNTAIAGDAVLAGNDAAALGDKFVPTIEESAKWGLSGTRSIREYVQSISGQKSLLELEANSRGELVDIMKRLGPGSRAIVGANRVGGAPGHAFNVVNNDGEILFWDFQGGFMKQPDFAVNIWRQFSTMTVFQTAAGAAGN
jgi:hypothetical protein